MVLVLSGHMEISEVNWAQVILYADDLLILVLTREGVNNRKFCEKIQI